MFRSLCLVLVVASPAWAALATETPESLFTDAKKKMAAKAYAEACPMLERSHRLEPALGTLLNLADCYEQLGRTASAFRAFNDAVAWAERTHEAGRASLAAERARALKAVISFVTVEMAERGTKATALVIPSEPERGEPQQWSLDGSLQSALVDPGFYTLRVEAAGRVPYEQPFQITAPGTMKLSVPLLALREVPGSETLQAETLTPPPMPQAVELVTGRASRATSSVGVTGVVVGSSLLVAGAIGLAYSRVIIDRVDSQQQGGTDAATPSVTRSEFKTIQTLQPLSIAALGIGAAALGTGVVLLVTNAHRDPSAVSFGLMASPQGASASVSGAF